MKNLALRLTTFHLRHQQQLHQIKAVIYALSNTSGR